MVFVFGSQAGGVRQASSIYIKCSHQQPLILSTRSRDQRESTFLTKFEYMENRKKKQARSVEWRMQDVDSKVCFNRVQCFPKHRLLRILRLAASTQFPHLQPCEEFRHHGHSGFILYENWINSRMKLQSMSSWIEYPRLSPMKAQNYPV